MRYYKRRLYSGRNAVARAADYISFRLIAFICCYLWFAQALSNNAARLLLSAAATGFVSVAADLIGSLRLDKFIKAERKRIADGEVARRLLLMTNPERMAVIRGYVKAHPEDFADGVAIYPLHRSSPVSEDDVLSALRLSRERNAPSVVIIHASEVSDGALAAAGEAARFISFRSMLDGAALSALAPSETEIDGAILASCAARKRKKKAALSSPFGDGRTRRYMVAAMGLLAASFFVEQALYYRLASAACISLGAIAWWLNRRTAQ